MADERPVTTEQDSVRRLAEIRERAEKATQGPWTADEWNDIHAGKVAVAEAYPNEGGGVYQEVDADFIAHSREDVPYLLSLIDFLTAERDNAVWRADRLDEAGRVQQSRAEAAEAEVKRLREALSNREQRMEAALGALDALGEFDHRTLGYEGYGAVIAIRAALATPPSEGG